MIRISFDQEEIKVNKGEYVVMHTKDMHLKHE